MHFVLEYWSEGQLSCKLLMVGHHENGTQFRPFYQFLVPNTSVHFPSTLPCILAHSLRAFYLLFNLLLSFGILHTNAQQTQS